MIQEDPETHKFLHLDETWEIECGTKNVIYKLEYTLARPQDRPKVVITDTKATFSGNNQAGHPVNLPEHNENMMRMLPIERVRPAIGPEPHAE